MSILEIAEGYAFEVGKSPNAGGRYYAIVASRATDIIRSNVTLTCHGYSDTSPEDALTIAVVRAKRQGLVPIADDP